MSDDLIFAAEETPSVEDTAALPWNVLVVDDEDTVHKITRLVLNRLTFDGRPLNLIEARSGEHAERVMREQGESIALALVDVVMESDDAGFKLIHAIRQEHKNHLTRIVLRTGQPGIAPEERVIQQYDINDYKEKTELTGTKLKTLIYSSLRSYRDILTIENQRRSLEKTIHALSYVNRAGSLPKFASAILDQLVNLIDLKPDAVYCVARRNNNETNHYTVLAATGELDQLLMQVNPLQEFNDDTLPEELHRAYSLALNERRSVHTDNAHVVYYSGLSGVESLLYIRYRQALSKDDKYLMEIFSADVIATYHTLLLQEEIKTTQSELIYILGEAVERRSKETGGHVKRVAEISALLAMLNGCTDEEVQHIQLTAPLHDLGKIAIPDSILNKPAKLDSGEWEIMKKHAQIGRDMLMVIDKPIFMAASDIAGYHHEKWDGSGYPEGLAGINIPLLGRITAIADVFDALHNKRCYKAAWPLDETIEFIRQARGKDFDPQLVDLFLSNIDQVVEISKQYPD